MIIVPTVKTTATAIRENSATDMFAIAIKNHSAIEFENVATFIKSGGDLKEIVGFTSSLAIIGLFVSHKDKFLKALNEIAFVHDQFAGGYMVEVTGGNKDSVIHSLAMINDYKYFEDAPACAQQACYEVIHAIVIHITQHIIASYNLQCDLLKMRIEAYENSLEAS